MVNVTLSGCAGRVGNALAFRVAAGDFFGSNEPVNLRLVEHRTPLLGLKMELEDCTFPTLASVTVTRDLEAAYADADCAVLFGTPPVHAGLSREQRLIEAALTVQAHAMAIERVAHANVRVVVGANPCNVGAWIGAQFCRRTSAAGWFALSMLDEMRAVSILAARLQVSIDAVTNLHVWGNHPLQIYPDYWNASVNGRPVTEVEQDQAWLETEFVHRVRMRFQEILAARGHSSVESAVEATRRTVRGIFGRCRAPFSACRMSSGEYGIPPGIVFSMPLRSQDHSRPGVLAGLSLNATHESRFAEATETIEREILVAAAALRLPFRPMSIGVA